MRSRSGSTATKTKAAPSADRHGGRHVCAPHHVGRLGGDGPVVRLRPMAWPARGGAWRSCSRINRRTRSFEGAHPRDPQLRPGFSVALAMKRRGFEHPANVGHQDVVRGSGRSARGDDTVQETVSPAAAHTHWSGRGATRGRPAARHTPDGWRSTGRYSFASTSAGPKGRRPPAGPPSRTVTRSPSAARRSWPAADDGLRPEHPVRGSLGPPAPQPETEPPVRRPRRRDPHRPRPDSSPPRATDAALPHACVQRG